MYNLKTILDTKEAITSFNHLLKGLFRMIS